MSWGYHLALDVGKCCPKSVRCANTIYQFNKYLVKSIDMKAYGEPQIVMFGEGNKKGYTLVQLIETSNITAHFVEETDDIYLDIFSCKPYNIESAISAVNGYFAPEFMRINYFQRQAPHKNYTTLVECQTSSQLK